MSTDLYERVTHAYADNAGVKIHYAELGAGPLVVLVHGFPDFWYTWRNQLDALAERYHVAALDLRGYNLSDKSHVLGRQDGTSILSRQHRRSLRGDEEAKMQDQNRSMPTAKRRYAILAQPGADT